MTAKKHSSESEQSEYLPFLNAPEKLHGGEPQLGRSQ